VAGVVLVQVALEPAHIHVIGRGEAASSLQLAHFSKVGEQAGTIHVRYVRLKQKILVRGCDLCSTNSVKE
jgi:hypothetical protein